jgi:uncharacterized membrane protein
MRQQGELRARDAIVRVLQVGAWTATILMALGVLLLGGMSSSPGDARYLLEHPEKLVRDLFLQPSAAAYTSAGLFLLVMTPLVRLGVTAFGFARGRDWKYTAISVGVLIVILMGVALGR